MKVKYMFAASITVLLLALMIAYCSFQKQGNARDSHTEEKEKTIQVLVSDEVCTGQKELEEIAEKFSEEKEGIEVHIEWADREDIKKKVCVGANDEKQPDLVICSNKEISGFMEMGLLQEISSEELIESLYSETIYSGLWQSAMSDGKHYGIPFTVDPYVLYYNSDYFEKKNLQKPESWEEIMEICANIREPGFYGISFGIRRSGDASDFFDCLLYSCGGNYYSLDSEPGKMAINYLDELKRRGYFSKDAINNSPKDAAANFKEGKAAMFLAPLSMAVYLNEDSGSVKFAISPSPSAIKEGYALTGNSLGILDEEDGLTQEFITYLYETQQRKQILTCTGTLPVFECEQDISVTDRELSDIFYKNGVVLPNYNSWFETSSILSEYVYKVLALRNINLDKNASELQDKIRVAIMG